MVGSRDAASSRRLSRCPLEAAYRPSHPLTTFQPLSPLPLCSVVQHLALRKMSVGFRAWRYVVAYRRHARASVEESVARLAQRTQATAWAAWQECVAQRRVERHRVAVCQRRSALGAQRAALAAWRQVAAAKAAERQVVSLCQRRADRIRWEQGPC